MPTATIKLITFHHMTYTDNYKYDAAQMMHDDLQLLRDATETDKPKLFVEYCRKAIAAKETNLMPLRDAAFSIARVMFIKELEDPVFDEITGLAGELELPAEFVVGDPEEKWHELAKIVSQYAEQHRAEAWLSKIEDEQNELERKTSEVEKEYGDR